MSLFESLSIFAYYGQLVVIGVGLWQMHRASTLRNKQLDEQHAETMTAMKAQHGETMTAHAETMAVMKAQHEENMAAHEESMTALKELIVRTAPRS